MGCWTESENGAGAISAGVVFYSLKTSGVDRSAEKRGEQNARDHGFAVGHGFASATKHGWRVSIWRSARGNRPGSLQPRSIEAGGGVRDGAHEYSAATTLESGDKQSKHAKGVVPRPALR